MTHGRGISSNAPIQARRRCLLKPWSLASMVLAGLALTACGNSPKATLTDTVKREITAPPDTQTDAASGSTAQQSKAPLAPPAIRRCSPRPAEPVPRGVQIAEAPLHHSLAVSFPQLGADAEVRVSRTLVRSQLRAKQVKARYVGSDGRLVVIVFRVKNTGRDEFRPSEVLGTRFSLRTEGTATFTLPSGRDCGRISSDVARRYGLAAPATSVRPGNTLKSVVVYAVPRGDRPSQWVARGTGKALGL